MKLQSPYPYFGGKSRVADLVWKRLGDPMNYVEPFFGSGAVLLMRPNIGNIETVNDLDGFVSNFWRALQADPDSVAEYADWPVNECDLHARHCWLMERKDGLPERLMGDPDYYDAKIAGYWVWGVSCWIGSGWCSGNGPWHSVDGVFTKTGPGGVNRQRPHLGNAGQGVNRQRPHLGRRQGVNRQLPHLGRRQGVNRQLPHLGCGQGVNRKLPHLGRCQGVSRQLPQLNNAGQGVNRKHGGLREYMRALADRMRNVRVCCGDWKRVCGFTPTSALGLTGVFLDPPYSDGKRASVYDCESFTVAHDVRAWAIERGNDPKMRIALCGYEGEHEMPDGWVEVAWKTKGGYGSQGNGQGRDNSARERIWFSPHCLRDDSLFEVGAVVK